MIEIGEDLTLVAKTPYDEIGVHAALDLFYRHALRKLFVIALAKIDRTHAPASDLA